MISNIDFIAWVTAGIFIVAFVSFVIGQGVEA